MPLNCFETFFFKENLLLLKQCTLFETLLQNYSSLLLTGIFCTTQFKQTLFKTVRFITCGLQIASFLLTFSSVKIDCRANYPI